MKSISMVSVLVFIVALGARAEIQNDDCTKESKDLKTAEEYLNLDGRGKLTCTLNSSSSDEPTIAIKGENTKGEKWGTRVYVLGDGDMYGSDGIKLSRFNILKVVKYENSCTDEFAKNFDMRIFGPNNELDKKDKDILFKEPKMASFFERYRVQVRHFKLTLRMQAEGTKRFANIQERTFDCDAVTIGWR
jgi:hypothetical protein